jgi:ferredoxin
MNKVQKSPGNAPGRFYTTDCCIACDACVFFAPKNFKSDAAGIYVVSKQPSTPEELEAVTEAYLNILNSANGPGPCIIDSEDIANTPPELLKE